MKYGIAYPVFLGIIPLAFSLTSCVSNYKNTLFTQLSSSESGIHFNNDVKDNDSSYSFINEFGYMGGGVGIGDFNNDGLKDIFFSGNQVSCRLYLNKGNNKFEDITKMAGVTTNVWCTGVGIADVNNDGYDDIYVCVFGKDLKKRSKNLLFINQHDLTFKESAADYGLADTGYSTQAAFLDYDNDGDLDMYVVNYLLADRNANTIYPRDRSGFSDANDRLYRNEGDQEKKGHPFFRDVTMEAGIKEDGYGLGISVSDFNSDGWPDIYVANDFVSNDEMWLNNQDGTFVNCIVKSLRHQSYSSMGSDAADLNNDARPDIITLDMLPETNERKKTSVSFMNYERYQSERRMGYEPEFMRNMLQLNEGSYRDENAAMPFFSEIGQLSGIQATDWSWSVLIADFDNDGWKDIHVTNGIGRDFINGDFLAFSGGIFNSDVSRDKQEEEIRKRLAALDHINLPNYLYINNHDYTFTDASERAGINKPSMSNGAAYADLDNDGDLDIIVNNIGQEAFVFMNNTIQKGKPITNHFLSVRLKGDSLNTRSFGAKIILYQKDQEQMQEENPVRGYFSSVDQELLFGLGEDRHVDSIIVIWPDNRREVIKDVAADTTLTLYKEKAGDAGIKSSPNSISLFSDITSASGIAYRHTDAIYNDFANQWLLPQKYSQLGPFIATGDINNDGSTDFFVGGGFNFSGKIFTQQKGNSFVSRNLTDSIKWEEDVDCILFDADNDGDSDLLVTCGDTRYPENSPYYKPRLYLNDGKGNFKLESIAIPDAVKTIAGCVSAADFDGDGDQDLFIGGRVSLNYPTSPRSYILQNNKGIFTDETSKVCPALERPGMITGATWADFDEDKQPDLVVTGEWMPLRFFRNDHGKLHEVTGETGLTEGNGMWRCLLAADIDNDGDIDFIAGNQGLNCDYQPSPEEPMQLYATDLDHNGSIDPVLFYFIKDKSGEKHSFPAIGLNQFASQVPAIKKKYLMFRDYANATYADLFKGVPGKSILKFDCDETRSCYFENLGNGRFVKHILPMEAQFAPVNAIICDDLDHDGIKDLLLAGNEYQMEVMTGRYDASYGCFLKGNSNKKFTVVPPGQSGFILKGDVKDMAIIQLADNRKLILAAVNDDSLRVFSINK